jgi:class 3 adenylate cyclase
MYAGLDSNAPGRALHWSALAGEAGVAEAMRERLASVRPMAMYGAVACGTDIVCIEAMQALGGETHVVLPFPLAEYHRTSPGFAGSDWAGRFERVLALADSVTVTSDHLASGSTATFEYSQLVLRGMARLRAERLQTELHTLGGGVEAPVAPEARLPPGFTHEIRAMLFADAVGYSALTEDQTASFVTGFLSAVAELNGRTAHRPEHVETSGDGLYMVFAGVRDAGFYALELNQLVSGTDWVARGLPGGLIFRIALHCGPVFCGRNPVTGTPLYTGPHTNRTARIEPITPPGQVYVSSAFAAVAAASGVDGLAMQYIGRMPLAKDYGLFGLYHLRPAQEPASEAAGLAEQR